MFGEVHSSCSWFQAWASFPFIQQFLALSIITPSVLDAGAIGEVRAGPVLAGTDREVTYCPRAVTEVCASSHGAPEQCRTGVGVGRSQRLRVEAGMKRKGALWGGSLGSRTSKSQSRPGS